MLPFRLESERFDSGGLTMPKYAVYPVGERKIIEAPDEMRAAWGYVAVYDEVTLQVDLVSDGEPDLIVGKDGEIITEGEV